MNRQIIYSILSVLLSSFLFAQDTTFYFNKTYLYYDNFTNLKPTTINDNHIYTFGYGLLNSSTSYFFLQKTDFLGNEIWVKNIGEDHVSTGFTYGNCGLKSKDGHLIFSGYKEQNNGFF